MQTKTEKTYACKNATPNSKNKIARRQLKPKIKNHNFILVIFKTNELIIKTKVWPAIILALNRIAKLNARII